MMQARLKQKFSFKRIRLRIVLVSILYLLLFVVVALRAFELHLNDNIKLDRLANNQYKRRVVVAPKRGNILDSHLDTLAIDVQVDSIYAAPNTIEDPAAFAKTVAPGLQINEMTILEKISNKKKKFVWLKRRIDTEESKKLKELKLKGLGFLPEYKRFYPNGELASNLLGAVGYDAVALSGLEMTYDSTLKSVDPPMLVEQDARGRSYEPFALVGLEHPNEIVLTLDKTIQYIAERELKTTVEKYKAKGGVALVMDVETGGILAMATQPTFDPNEYYKYDVHQWRNRSVTDTYEPGSIFKAITAAAALEAGVIDLKQTMFCENGAMKVGKFTIHDHHGYGNLSLSDIIKYSSNICSYKLAQKVGKEKFYEFVRAFGFGSPTGVEAPGEVGGILTSLKNLSQLQLGTIAFGQGISTTPIQIATAYVAIANGGKLMKPYLVKEIRDFNGKSLKTFEPKMERRVLSEVNAKAIARLLETVVEKGGTGTAARLQSQRVAGKTGTAQKVIAGQKGYAKNQYVASFVGFAPARDPKLVVLVTIDEPHGEYYGGLVSAPPFREIMEQSLAYLKVAPDAVYIAEKDSPKLTGEHVSIAEKTSKTEKKDKSKLNDEGRVDSDLSPDLTISADSEGGKTEATLTSGESSAEVPDFTGLSVREVMRKAQSQNFKVQIKGSGICKRQDPRAGGTLEKDASIVLECEPPI